MKYACNACGEEISDADAFCGACGAEVVVGETLPEQPGIPAGESASSAVQVCISCGETYAQGDTFCPWCGVATAAENQDENPPQDIPQPVASAADSTKSAVNQGTDEIADRFRKTWDQQSMRAPLVALGLLTIGFLLPLVSLKGPAGFSGSFTLSDLTGISVFVLLLISVVLLALLVVGATSSAYGDLPTLVVTGIAFVLAVLATIMTTIALLGSIGMDQLADSLADELDEDDIRQVSLNLGLGCILLVLGSVGLFVSSTRLYRGNNLEGE